MVGRCCRSGRRTSRLAVRAPRRRSRAGRGLLARAATRRSRPTSSRRSSRASPTGSATGRPSPGAARSPTRCASSASGRRCARTRRERGVRLFGDVPIYVADRRRRLGRAPGALPDARRRRRAARRATARSGQLWGNPLYDWQAHAREGYRWWIERFRRTFELFDLRGSTTSAASSPTGPCPRGAGRREAAAGGAGRASSSSTATRGARRAAARRRGPRRDHAGRRSRCATGSASPGWSCCSSPSTGRPSSPHRLENHRENAVVYTGTHDNDTALGWWCVPAGADARGRPASTRRRSRLGADRARALLARAARDRPGPGRARPRQRGADEHARPRARATGRGGCGAGS